MPAADLAGEHEGRMMLIAGSSKGRRDFLRKSGVVASSVLLTAWRESEHALGDELTPTPACKDHPEHTRPQTEGPYFFAELAAARLAASAGNAWHEDCSDRPRAVYAMHAGSEFAR